MAKKSLKKRIDDLIDALGGAEKPTFAKIRSELVSIGTLVEALEDAQALAEKDARIADLEAEFENLKVTLQTANTELETFRAEREKQEEENRELPEIQLEILRRLPSKHGGIGLTVPQIWREVNGRLDEIEIHVDKLEKAGLIAWHMEADGEKFWRRTMAGNELVVAKRLAGEEDKKAHKHADLPKEQHEALLMIGSDPEGANENSISAKVGASILLTQRNLRKLREAGMATDGDEPQETYGTGQMWWLLERGEEYLAERDLL